MTDRVEMRPSKAKPCAQCPWRTSNHGRKPDPHRFYTLANLRRLWRGMRAGERMTCHPTDPEMAEFEGYEKTSERGITFECAGAQTLIQRELVRFGDACKEGEREGKKDGLKRYRAANPKGLTRDGLASHVAALSFGGNPMFGMAVTRLDLNAEDISHPDLTPWEKR